MAGRIPEVRLHGGDGRMMPAVGLGTASFPPSTAEVFRAGMLDAIALGYRHFDTAAAYHNEGRLGEVIAEALQLGLVASRDELFITSKLNINDTYGDRVLPAIKQSLRNLQLEYLDLYLIHWPLSVKPTETSFPYDPEGIRPLDMNSVWGAMEECHRLGLAKAIGVSNFSCKKLDQICTICKVPPAVNQVEMHPVWQQKKLMEFCKEKGMIVTAYSPLGGNGTPWGTNQVIECEVLREIAVARGKSVAQVSLKWICQQGASLIVKTFKKERLKENIEIFDWELSEEELHKISQIPQYKGCRAEMFTSKNGAFKSLDDLWDGEI